MKPLKPARQIRGMRQGGVNDEPLRRASYEVKRIASHESQRIFRTWLKHRDVLRTNDKQFIHDVTNVLLRGDQLNWISLVDVLQDAKKAIAMPRNANIAAQSRFGGSLDVTHGSIQRELVRTFKDRNLQVNTGNSQTPKGSGAEM